MKIRLRAALLLAALAILLFSGCTTAAGQQLDVMADKAEHQLDAIEETIESRLEALITESPIPATPAPAAVPTPTAPPATAPATLLSKEEAEKIALEHAGFTADQVQRLRTELDYDRGKPEYEVDFHVDRWEYDYEIDAETGKILSFDKDWND